MNITTDYSKKSNTEDDFDFRKLLFKYLQRWKLFAFMLSISLATAFLVNKFTPDVYKTEGKIQIRDESNPMNLLSAGNGNEILPKGQKMANDMIVLKSRRLAGKVLDRLSFDVQYYENDFLALNEIYRRTPIRAEVDWTHKQLTAGDIKISWHDEEYYEAEFSSESYQAFVPGRDEKVDVSTPETNGGRYRFGSWVDLPYARFRIYFTGEQTEGTLLVRFLDRETLLATFTGESLQIYPVDKTSSIVTLSLETNDPHKGRDYLNTLMSVFLENELNEKNTTASNTIRFIDSQLSGVSDSLSAAGNKLERFQSRRRTYNISTEGNTIFEKLSDLEKSLAEEKFRKKYYQNLSTYLENESYHDIIAPSSVAVDDKLLNGLIEELLALQADKSRYRATQTDNSPTVKEVNRKITNLNNSIREVLRNVDRNSDLRITDLQTRIHDIESKFGSLPETEQELLNIRRKYSLNENIYSFLLQRRAESAITLASNSASNKIIDEAALNLVPQNFRHLVNYLLAVLTGLLAPMMILSLTDLFSFKVKDIDEVEQKLRVPVLGVVGANRTRLQMIVMKNPKASITESFRALRTNINFIVSRNKKVTIMLTSSVAGEGKTFCAINLASVYAISGKKTVLVSCDMRKPFSMPEVKISNEEGLSTFLSNQVTDIRVVIQKTEFENLDILPAGPIPPNPSELLVSDRFEELISKLRDHYDVIILDSSPVGITNETLHLTRIADFTLFVLRQRFSLKKFADDVNALKEKKGVKNIYALFNGVASKNMKYHGYGYGYYAEDQSHHPVRKVVEFFKKHAAI